jgi:hypothetical protein
MAEFPTEAKYMRIKNYNDKVLARHTTRISPFNGSRFGPAAIDRILFNIPSETGMEIDMDTLMFHFSVVVDVGDAGVWDIAFCNSIESVIQNLRIRKGSSFLIEDIQRYNYLDSMFMNYLSRDYNDCVGRAIMGIGPYHSRKMIERVENGAQNEKRFCIPFRLSGISNYSGLISTSLIDQVSAFQFEIELAPAKDALQINLPATGAPPATASYELNECFLSYDLVRMAPDYHAQLQSSINRGIPLQIPYKTWRTSLYSLAANSPTTVTFNINDTVKSLNAVFVAFFKQNEQNTFLVPGKDRKHKPPTLTGAQIQLGSFYYPLQPMDCRGAAPQVFLELQKALGLAYVRSEYQGPFGFDGSQFHTPSPNQVQNLSDGIRILLAGRNAGGAAIANTTAPAVIKNDNGIAINASILTGGKPNAAGGGGDAAVNGGIFTNDTHTTITITPNGNGAEYTANIPDFYQQTCQGPCTEFMLGFNMKKVLDATEGEIVGTDIQSSGSGLMTLRLDFSATPSEGPYNVVVASLYDAVLEIQSNQQAFRVE